MARDGPYLLLYDADCRICAAFARALRFVTLGRRIHVRSIQDSRSLLLGMAEDDILGSAHAISPEGLVTTGADAMPMLAGALLGKPQIEGRLRSSPASMRFLSGFYAFLADLRGRLTCGLAAPSSGARTPR